MPIWAYTLAAHITDDKRFRMSLHDCRFPGGEDIARADVFLFSGMNQDCANLSRICRALRARYPEARFLIGGPICWSFDQAGALDQLEAFDHLCIGDGEELIVEILDGIAEKRELGRVIRAPARFDITQARPLFKPLLEATHGRYYGAVLEVSRGCPFLCEFCDIRILKDNNRPHNKSPDLIVAELRSFAALGIRQVIFACDNFIGDPRWAEDVIDAILAWEEEADFRPSLYTWLTINLYKHDRLMQKMRRAGFDMLFIGIESFSKNSLLETAKVQNTAAELIDAIRHVQSFGFIIVAGIIFGFDSDDARSFQRTLDGLRDSSLLSGDPVLLTALPGTPLYRRMELSGRLRDVNMGLGGYHYQTNIRYLMGARVLMDGYKGFVREYSSGRYQYERLRGYFDLLREGNFVPLAGRSFGNLALFIKMLVRNTSSIWPMVKRLARFAKHPSNTYFACKGLALALFQSKSTGGLAYFQFWLFAWTNTILKYQNISDKDFDIESVGSDFDIRDILPAGYEESLGEDIPARKTEAQRRATVSGLRAVIAEHST